MNMLIIEEERGERKIGSMECINYAMFFTFRLVASLLCETIFFFRLLVCARFMRYRGFTQRAADVLTTNSEMKDS